ncbi:Proline utilization trans-activator [Yarrowia sp. B02]|nr:Proline utilization trans-activator [Yarrowia sp. B02]
MSAKASKSADKDKRASSACERCRKRHARCSGGDPCVTCAKLNAPCVYPEAEKKIVVSLKYWKKLQDEIQQLKEERTGLGLGTATLEAEKTYKEGPNPKRPRVDSPVTSVDSPGQGSPTKVTVSSLCSDEDHLINPIRDQKSELTSTRNGQQLFSGSSSTSRFGQEVACMLRDKKSGTNESLDMGLFTYRGIRLTKKGPLTLMLKCTECNNSDYRDDIEITMPARDDALRFLNQFQTHLGACYYFCNELWTRNKIYEIYAFLETLQNHQVTTLTRHEASWYCQILLISAIGEMYGAPREERQNMADDPPGGENFRNGANALSLLYGKELMGDSCPKLIELLLCYSFYLQVLDFSTSSAVYIGMAMRTAVLCGLHVDASKDSLSREELEHRRRLWWTTYILELYSCSKQGIPPSLNLESVATGLPESLPEFYDAVYMNSFIEVARLGCLVLDSLYHHHNDNKNILPALNAVIEKLFEWRNNIPDRLKVDYSQSPLIVSRPVVNIHSEYFQCINLSVRPLLIHFVQRRISSLSADGKLIELSLSKFSPSIRRLLNASFQASVCSISAISSLLDTGMLAVQGYMDREYVFVSAATLVLFGAAFGSHDSIDAHIETAIKIMTAMHNAGNKPASLRLEQLISLRDAMRLECRTPQTQTPVPQARHYHHDEFAQYTSAMYDNNLFTHSDIPELSTDNALDRELFDDLSQHPVWMGEWVVS